ncbi:DUF6477 family protein [Sulfitobacter sp. SK012]|uniref:DUF6477 family protein n=1 Tax=Sulfitobacter sp. SK012 TaxID=1389005 RepID=UPI0026878F3E
MQDLFTMLNTLQRPRILMRAARIGAQDYRRTAHLPRLLGYGTVPRHGTALMKLIELEAELETDRTATDAWL